MNGRIIDEPTLTKRLAALYRSILIHYSVVGLPNATPIASTLDYADFELLIDPFAKYEEFLIRKDERTRLDSPLRREMIDDEIAKARGKIEASGLIKIP